MTAITHTRSGALRLTLQPISAPVVFLLFTISPFLILLPFSSLSPSCHTSEKKKRNWQHRREIDVMKNNWDISMSHLLCGFGHPRSPQRGSGLSVAIGGILQISQQLSEGYRPSASPTSLPHKLTPPGTSSTPSFGPNSVSVTLDFL